MFRKFLLLLVLVPATLLATVHLVSAHAELVKSDPAADAVLPNPPAQVTLWFDEPVDASLSTIAVLDATQAHHEQGRASIVPGDDKQLRIPLGPLADGTFTVIWNILSAADGHPTRGTFSFSVGRRSAPAVSPTAGSQTNAGADPGAILVRWIDLLALLTLAGAVFFRDLVLIRSLRAVGGQLDSEIALVPWRRVFTLALGLALLVEILRLLLQVQVATGAIGPGAVAQILFETRLGFLGTTRWVALTVVGLLVLPLYTRAGLLVAVAEIAVFVLLYAGILENPTLVLQFGQWWDTLSRVGITEHLIHIAPLFLFVVLVVSRDALTRRLLTLLVTLGILLTLALGSHPAAEGVVSFAVMADWLHLTAVSIWVGGLLALVAVLGPMRRTLEPGKRQRWLAELAARFSGIALVSVALITLTGMYIAQIEIPSPEALLQTLYGQTLDLKLVLFGILFVMGAVQVLRMRPRLAQAEGEEQVARAARAFRQLVRLEVVVGVIVVGLAGFLGSIPTAKNAGLPASSAGRRDGAPATVIYYGHPARDLKVSLSVTRPPGEVQAYRVYVGKTDQEPAQDVLRVILEFTLLDEDVGVKRVEASRGSEGEYLATGDYMGLPGLWDIRLTVRRAGLEDTAVLFPYYIPPPAGPAAENDPRALEWLRRSDAAMNRLTSVRSVQELNDGLHAVVTTDYEYAAPNLLRFTVNRQSESIAVGGTQYDAENGNWTSRPRVEPFAFPNFNNGEQAVRARLGRIEILDGVPMQLVLADLDRTSTVHYAFWIDPNDGRLHRIAMVGPAHFMLQNYFDFNAPVSIQAPPAK